MESTPERAHAALSTRARRERVPDLSFLAAIRARSAAAPAPPAASWSAEWDRFRWTITPHPDDPEGGDR